MRSIYFVSALLPLFFCDAVFAQLTAPSAHDTSTPKPVYSITNIRLRPITSLDFDNSIVNAGQEFQGASLVPPTMTNEKENKHLTDIRQLTFSGSSKVTDISPDDKWIAFQTHGSASGCDQAYMMDMSGHRVRRISNGRGKAEDPHFIGDQLIFTSTFNQNGGLCPLGYEDGALTQAGYRRLPIIQGMDVYMADTSGHLRGNVIVRGTDYYGDLAISPDRKHLAFVSNRTGDLEIFTSGINGSGIEQLTTDEGFDGQPSFDAKAEAIVYSVFDPQGDEVGPYRANLKNGFVQPPSLDIKVMNADGSHKRTVLANGSLNMEPVFSPDSKWIVFTSNLKNKKNFNLYRIHEDGSNLEQLTFLNGYTGTAHFTHDGKQLIFSSDRGAASASLTNLFVAHWTE